MRALVEKEIRGSFANCSKGEASRLNLPRGLADLPWADLDFLGWRDPGAPDRGYVVAERDGELVGITLRASTGIRKSLVKSSLCTLCLTSHSGSGVTLLAAPKVGAAGRQGNTVGSYMCSDLACSLYIRGKNTTQSAKRLDESLTEDEQIERMLANLGRFLNKVFE